MNNFKHLSILFPHKNAIYSVKKEWTPKGLVKCRLIHLTQKHIAQSGRPHVPMNCWYIEGCTHPLQLSLLQCIFNCQSSGALVTSRTAKPCSLRTEWAAKSTNREQRGEQILNWIAACLFPEHLTPAPRFASFSSSAPANDLSLLSPLILRIYYMTAKASPLSSKLALLTIA